MKPRIPASGARHQVRLAARGPQKMGESYWQNDTFGYPKYPEK